MNENLETRLKAAGTRAARSWERDVTISHVVQDQGIALVARHNLRRHDGQPLVSRVIVPWGKLTDSVVDPLPLVESDMEAELVRAWTAEEPGPTEAEEVAAG